MIEKYIYLVKTTTLDIKGALVNLILPTWHICGIITNHIVKTTTHSLISYNIY